MPQCSVPECHVMGGYQFPCDPVMRNRWIVAIRRGHERNKAISWTPGKEARVCSKHFHDSDYLSINKYGFKPRKRQLKKDAVPHVEFALQKPSQSTTARKERLVRRIQERNQQQEEICYGAQDVATVYVISEQDVGENEVPTEAASSMTGVSSVAVQTTDSGKQLYKVEHFSDKMIHFYTGLDNYAKCLFVLRTLGSVVYNLRYYSGVVPSLPVEDQFFLTLIRLRRNSPYEELALWFGMSQNSASNIFITWINLMYYQWNEINWWPSRNLVQYFGPSDFWKKYPKTRVIIDGTEYPMKKPSLNPLLQQSTFSTYKNRNTMKVLVGSTPGGLVSYQSKAYGGSVSDRQIIEQSSLPSICEPYDEIMADKGFNVDIFLPQLVKINMPAFFKKTNRLSGAAVRKDRKIAIKRVHIERIIGSAKTYRILCEPLSATESSLATEISFVTFTLYNFRKCIVPENA